VILEGCGLHRTYEPLVGGWVLGAPVGGRTVTLAGWGDWGRLGFFLLFEIPRYHVQDGGLNNKTPKLIKTQRFGTSQNGAF
jgi:hypothetical protein